MRIEIYTYVYLTVLGPDCYGYVLNCFVTLKFFLLFLFENVHLLLKVPLKLWLHEI